jgi:hypothetical protein
MKVLIEGGIFKRAASASYGAGEISFYGIREHFADYILIAPYTIETEIDDVDTTAIEVAALNEMLAEENLAHEVKVTEIQRKINDLLCLENKPSWVEE